MSQKELTESDLKEYQKTHDSIISKLIEVKRDSESKKTELVHRLIEVSEPLSHGKLCSKPEDLCITLWKELESNGLSEWISYYWFSSQFPDYLKRKYSKSQPVDNYIQIGKLNNAEVFKSDDQKRIKIDDKIYELVDVKQKEDKVEKEAARNLLKEELKESIVIDCIRTSGEFLDQFKSFLNRMEEKFKENPKILDDFENTLAWEDLYDMCVKLKSLYTGEGSIIRQMHQETNFRAPATILQLALAKSLGILDTYRNWAHKLTVSPRQYQRIRERLGDWPEKKAPTIIEKSLGSVSCPKCRFNLVTHKTHPRFKVVDTKDESKDFLQVYLGNCAVKIPEEFQEHGANPIQVCEAIFLNKLDKE